MTIEPALAAEQYCYLTTTGRVSGEPRTIEIWFAIGGETLYMLSGGRDGSYWVKNIRRTPAVTMRIGDQHLAGEARLVTDDAEDALARRLLLEKYAPGYERDLTGWGRTSLPVAIDLSVEDAEHAHG
jgi:deazaflavin-dependent oxidoreductase (nitroreductase family)